MALWLRSSTHCVERGCDHENRAQVVLAGLLLGLLRAWSRRAGWDQAAVLAAGLAVLAPYAWFAYRQADLTAGGIVVVVGNVILDVAIFFIARTAFRRVDRDPAGGQPL